MKDQSIAMYLYVANYELMHAIFYSPKIPYKFVSKYIAMYITMFAMLHELCDFIATVASWLVSFVVNIMQFYYSASVYIWLAIHIHHVNSKVAVTV